MCTLIAGLGSIAGIAPIESLGGGLDSTEIPGVPDIPIPESTVEQVNYRTHISRHEMVADDRTWQPHTHLFISFSLTFYQLILIYFYF